MTAKTTGRLAATAFGGTERTEPVSMWRRPFARGARKRGRRGLATAAIVAAGVLSLVGGGIDREAAAAGTVTEEREIAAVDEVAVIGVGTLFITQGETEELLVTAEDRIMPHIETDVEDGVLTIQTVGQFSSTEPVVYELTVPDLRAIGVAGAADVESEALATEELVLVAKGSGTIAVADLAVEQLVVSIDGAAEVALAGSAGQQFVLVKGSGTFDAAGLQSEAAAVSVDGSGEAVVDVRNTLEAETAGAGSIQYAGDPEVNAVNEGAGSVEPIG